MNTYTYQTYPLIREMLDSGVISREEIAGSSGVGPALRAALVSYPEALAEFASGTDKDFFAFACEEFFPGQALDFKTWMGHPAPPVRGRGEY